MYTINAHTWYSDLNIHEVLRYAGIRDERLCGEDMLQQAYKAVNEAGEAASPKHISRECQLTFTDNGCIIDGLFISGMSLRRHLKDCEGAVLFAATLGSGVDTLIRRYSEVRMSYAVMLQAAAATLIEHYCDACGEALEQQYARQGRWLRPRFSPGYGDFPLTCQTALLDRLNAYKYTGITVSSGGLMTPIKSVTAVIGITRQKQSGRTGSCAGGKCADCPHVECEFRRV